MSKSRVLENLDNFEDIFNTVNEALEDRYETPPGFFEDKLRLIPKTSRTNDLKWFSAYLRRIMVHIRSATGDVEYDQFSLVRLDNEVHKILDHKRCGEYDDLISDIIEERYSQITTSQFYLDYMREINEKLLEYRKFARMRNQIDLNKIDQYLKKHPDYDWNFTFSELFDTDIDATAMVLITRFDTLLRLLRDL